MRDKLLSETLDWVFLSVFPIMLGSQGVAKVSLMRCKFLDQFALILFVHFRALLFACRVVLGVNLISDIQVLRTPHRHQVRLEYTHTHTTHTYHTHIPHTHTTHTYHTHIHTKIPKTFSNHVNEYARGRLCALQQQLRVEESHVTSSHVTSSHVTSSHVTSSHVTYE
jgi:hypothetical protein